MGVFTRIAAASGWDSGRRLLAAIADIDANFQLMEPAIKDSAAANYVPVLTDRLITRSNAGAQTLTLPTNVAVAYPIGTQLVVIQAGAGALTLVAPGGGAINKLATKTLVVAGQWGVVRLIKTAANTWVASGDLTVA